MAYKHNVQPWVWAAGSLGLLGFTSFLLWATLRGRAHKLPHESPAFPVVGGHWPSAAKLQFGFERSDTHTHQGVDIPAPEGASVVAALGGTVVQVCAKDSACAGFHGYGKVVVIETAPRDRQPRLWWLYAHLARVDVRAGQPVQAGQRIGAVGRTYYTQANPTALFTSGPHLHLEASPRPYPQASEAWRYNPETALAVAAGDAGWAQVEKTA